MAIIVTMSIDIFDKYDDSFGFNGRKGLEFQLSWVMIENQFILASRRFLKFIMFEELLIKLSKQVIAIKMFELI